MFSIGISQLSAFILFPLTLFGEQSQKYHLENPYWKTFDPAVLPLLDRPMDLRRHEELEVEAEGSGLLGWAYNATLTAATVGAF